MKGKYNKELDILFIINIKAQVLEDFYFLHLALTLGPCT